MAFVGRRWTLRRRSWMLVSRILLAYANWWKPRGMHVERGSSADIEPTHRFPWHSPKAQNIAAFLRQGGIFTVCVCVLQPWNWSLFYNLACHGLTLIDLDSISPHPKKAGSPHGGMHYTIMMPSFHVVDVPLHEVFPMLQESEVCIHFRPMSRWFTLIIFELMSWDIRQLQQLAIWKGMVMMAVEMYFWPHAKSTSTLHDTAHQSHG